MAWAASSQAWRNCCPNGASQSSAFRVIRGPAFPGDPASKVVYLAQNWSPAYSQRFYFTAQGSEIVPYDWFLVLEQAENAKPFRDNQNILKYRYLPQKPDAMNPDGLPVGFVGAMESKEALAADGRVPFLIVRGRKGGSAMAVAAVNALASDQE